MPEIHLTLSGPGQSGEVVWDDEAGTFRGTDAELLNECSQGPQAHPAWPYAAGLAATDKRALIVLLAVLGWDVPPELADEAAKWRKEGAALPRNAVA